MILRLGLPSRALDAEPRQALAQARQGPLMQKAGQVVRAIGQKLATTEPDKEIEEFALGALGARLPCRLGQRDMREPERTRIAVQTGDLVEQSLVGRARQKR